MTKVDEPLLLLTRPRDASERLAATIREDLGLEAVISPILEIFPSECSAAFENFSAAILTSPSAAHLLPAIGVPKEMRFYAVGDRTAAVASSLGYPTQSAAGDVEALFSAILKDPPSGSAVHLRGEHTKGNLAQRLTMSGVHCEERVIYQQIAQELSADAVDILAGARPVILPLFSPRSAALVLKAATLGPNVWPVAMSPAVAEEFEAIEVKNLTIAAKPTEASMLRAIAETEPVRVWVEGKVL